MTENFTNNTNKEIFELDVNGSVSFAKYRIKEAKLYIDHVEAPQELRGTGAAGRLMQHIVDYAIEHKLEITPICGYAKQWMFKHKI